MPLTSNKMCNTICEEINFWWVKIEASIIVLWASSMPLLIPHNACLNTPRIRKNTGTWWRHQWSQCDYWYPHNACLNTPRIRKNTGTWWRHQWSQCDYWYPHNACLNTPTVRRHRNLMTSSMISMDDSNKGCITQVWGFLPWFLERPKILNTNNTSRFEATCFSNWMKLRCEWTILLKEVYLNFGNFFTVIFCALRDIKTSIASLFENVSVSN